MAQTWSLAGEHLDTLFASFLSFDRVLIAVSGGSDSLALLYLSAQWAQRHKDQAPLFEVATVDHGLRVGSRREALAVKQHAERCGFLHHLLEWNGLKSQHGVQVRAREARYALMERLARTWQDERVAIATAHTSEDQAETFLMRLARASGPDGLRCISSKRVLYPSSQIFLLRPFLRVSRADLRSWLVAHKIEWVDDPSNCDERFERVKLRQAEPTLRRLGLRPDKLALSAERQARAVAALEEGTTTLQNACFQLHAGAFGSLDRPIFERAPQELRVRLLQRVLNMYRGETPLAELEQVERLVGDLEKKCLLRQTLGGCEIHAKKDVLLVYREVGRASLVSTSLFPNVPIVWDRRFRILLSPSSHQKESTENYSNIVVRPLDLTVFRKLRDSGEKKYAIPVRAAATLPAVWWGDTLITIGALGSNKSQVHPSFSLTDQPIHAEFLYPTKTTPERIPYQRPLD